MHSDDSCHYYESMMINYSQLTTYYSPPTNYRFIQQTTSKPEKVQEQGGGG